jgi:hypothetical protein
MNIRLCVRFAILFAGTFAFAHGNYQHVMGTVTKVSPESVTVRTTANDTVEVAITSATKFSKADSVMTIQDVRVGDRVVIHATKTNDGKFIAHTVQIGVAEAAATSH